MSKEEKFVDVNGFQVMDLTPDMNRALALVDLDVLVKLTSYLGKANFSTIKHDLIEELKCIHSDRNGLTKLQQLVHICEEAVAFHKTVNLIQEVKNCNVTKHPLPDEPVTGRDIEDIR